MNQNVNILRVETSYRRWVFRWWLEWWEKSNDGWVFIMQWFAEQITRFFLNADIRWWCNKRMFGLLYKIHLIFSHLLSHILHLGWLRFNKKPFFHVLHLVTSSVNVIFCSRVNALGYSYLRPRPGRLSPQGNFSRNVGTVGKELLPNSVLCSATGYRDYEALPEVVHIWHAYIEW